MEENSSVLLLAIFVVAIFYVQIKGYESQISSLKSQLEEEKEKYGTLRKHCGNLQQEYERVIRELKEVSKSLRRHWFFSTLAELLIPQFVITAFDYGLDYLMGSSEDQRLIA